MSKHILVCYTPVFASVVLVEHGQAGSQRKKNPVYNECLSAAMLLGYWLVEDLIILIHFYDIPAFFVLLRGGLGSAGRENPWFGGVVW